ncbi:MAG: hypothetical protein ACOYBJ_01100 [Patescibacteria group bacterium]|jgi:hypothetical protein
MQTVEHIGMLGIGREQSLYHLWWGDGRDRDVLYMEVLTRGGTHCCCKWGSVSGSIQVGHLLDQGMAFVRSLCAQEARY